MKEEALWTIVTCFVFASTIKKLRSENVAVPDGIYCDRICFDYASLPGNTYQCLLSSNDMYHKFISRENGVMDWNFYRVGLNVKSNLLCRIAEMGDEFVRSSKQTQCYKPRIRKTRNLMRSDNPFSFIPFRSGNQVAAATGPGFLSKTQGNAHFASDESKQGESLNGETHENRGRNQRRHLFSNLVENLPGMSGTLPQLVSFSKIFNTDAVPNPLDFIPNPPVSKLVKLRKTSYNKPSEQKARLRGMLGLITLDPSLVCNLAQMKICWKRKVLTCSYEDGCCISPLEFDNCPPTPTLEPAGRCYTQLSLVLSDSSPLERNS